MSPITHPHYCWSISPHCLRHGRCLLKHSFVVNIYINVYLNYFLHFIHHLISTCADNKFFTVLCLQYRYVKASFYPAPQSHRTLAVLAMYNLHQCSGRKHAG